MKRLVLALVILLCATHAFAAGTITCTKTPGAVAIHTCSAVADATNATGTVPMMLGYVERVVTNPGDGAAAPSGVWACSLQDPNGVPDVLGAVVAGRSTTATEQVYQMAQDTTTVVRPYVHGTMTLTCTGIGDENTATITFYVKE